MWRWKARLFARIAAWGSQEPIFTVLKQLGRLRYLALKPPHKMAVVIRMKRTGRRNRPCYRISVAHKTMASTGRTLDNLGVYDPASPKEELRLTLNVERAQYWLSQGALPSDTVRSIFKRQGVYADAKPKAIRKRPGRKVVTKKKTARLEAKAGRTERKLERSTERASAKRVAAAAGEAKED